MSTSSSIISYSMEPSIRWMVPFYSKELTVIITSMLLKAHYAKDEKEISSKGLLLEVFFINDADMAYRNSTSMNCTGPTNVLSFPTTSYSVEDYASQKTFQSPLLAVQEKKFYFPKLGSLLLAPATIHRECLLYGQDTSLHFLRLLAHGLAHLMGYDHSQAMDELCEAMLSAGMVCVKSIEA